MTQPSVQSFFGTGKGKYAKFEHIGDSVTGTILMVHPPENATDPNGKVKTDKNGRPLQQLRIELETDERNPEIEYDDGVRTVYVQSFMTDAVTKALREAGSRAPEIGGKLTVTFTEEKPNPGLRPSKLYTAVYVPPTPTATSAFFGTQQSAPTNGPVKPDSIAQTAWDAMDESTKKAVAATMGQLSDEPPF